MLSLTCSHGKGAQVLAASKHGWLMTSFSMGDIINKFRNRALGLPSLSVRSGPGLADRLKVPWTYCMSPALVPKPKDWSNHIDVVGFYFLDLATSFTPPDDLAAFLAGGETPVYIGFGSVVVDDPEEMSRIIFEATAQAGVRAIVSAGWVSRCSAASSDPPNRPTGWPWWSRSPAPHLHRWERSS